MALDAAEEPAVLAGDYDGDGRVGQADLDLVFLHWGQSADAASDSWINDLPGGAIDQNALDAVLLNWGETAAGAATTLQSPPTGQPLAGVGYTVDALAESVAAQRPIERVLDAALRRTERMLMT